MPVSASVTIQSLRAEQHLMSHGPMLPRLWQAMRGEWQRMQDRSVAQCVLALDHAGVIEDFRTASRGNYR